MGKCTTREPSVRTQVIMWGSTSKVWTNKTCHVLAMSWFTRKTPPWVRRRNSTLRSRSWISQTKSRRVTHQSVSYDAAALRAGSRSWFGKWVKRLEEKKLEEPHSLKSNEMAQCSFQPQQPLVCDTFKNCEGLSRVAFMDGNGV